MSDPAEILLDLAGLKCPLPVLRTRKAMRALQEGGRLTVVCTDPMAAIDIPNLVREEGARLDRTQRDGDELRFAITVFAMPPHS
ncbi:sulfurtransferase TusA family protein [Methylobacterium sp. NFXW15]|uniref:sulfurtransferase TusA family protein n=1 Tax=Methylobacterium sp. NFXW15 TaxID=2819512 RepID=UPI003CE9BA64